MKAKRKRVRRYNGGEDSLVRAIVPAQIRTFVETLRGKRDPITEKDFTERELKQVRDAILAARKVSPNKAVDYPDYGKRGNLVRSDLDIGHGSAMRNTLGRFNYEKTPEGRLVAKDTYDFEDDLVGKEEVPRTRDYAGLSTAEKIGKLAADTLRAGVTTLPSRVGSAFIGANGRPVRIDLGEAPFKKGGQVRAKVPSSRGDGAARRGHTKGKVR